MNYQKKIPEVFISILSKGQVFYVLAFVIILLLAPIVLFSQTTEKEHTFGALLLTKEEYAKLPGPNWDTLRKYSNIKTISSREAKSSVMLNCPPIGDQGSQGSCVGWATGYAALGILTYPKYNCWNLATRSPSYVFNQIKVTCAEGAYVDDGVELVADEGSCSLSSMPYNQNECATQPNANQQYEASKHDAITWSALSPTNSVSSVEAALDLGYPVVCAFHVYTSFMTCWNDDGIWDVANSGTNLGAHAVCIVGYDDAQEMFKVQNSWGTGDGDNGFFWVTYDLVEDGLIDEMYILAGMNSAYQETITGSTLVCSAGTTFTVNYLESVCGITWNKSSNLSLSSSSGNTATFTANGNGAGYIQPTITSSGCSSHNLSNYLVWVGTPTVSITGPDEGCTYTSHTFRAQPTNYLSNPTSYSYWGIDPNDGYISTSGNGEYAFITFYNEYSVAGYDVEVKGTNTCGTGSFGYGNIWIYDCYYYAISPNPASDIVTINRVKASEDTDDKNILTKSDENTTSDIQIMDYYGSLHLQITKSGDSFTLPVSNLKDGTYFVKITNGNKTSSLKLVVKH